jgi:hypothetical protein
MIEAAAHVSLAGLSADKYLRTKDVLERLLMQRVTNRQHELENERDQYRAQLIANEIGKMLNSGFKK